RFRALARALDERGIVHAPPGMTARAFTGAAREFFPDRAAALDDAADAFADVRYLRRPGTRERFAPVAGLDAAAARARAALEREWTAPDPLDAESPRYDGARAVTTLLGERGVDVETAGDLDAARDGAERGATLVVTDASLVETEALRDLARTAPDVVILD